MTDFTMNQMTDRAESFDAIIWLHVGGDRYRLKTEQLVTIQYRWLNEVRYDDNGNKQLFRAGDDHTFSVNLLLTSDEVDTASPPTDPKTISYWIYQKTIGQRVQLTIEQVFATKSSNNNQLHHTFLADVSGVGTARQVGGGIEIPIDGVILALSTAPSNLVRNNTP